jgi:leukotriene-A4 hydrolase
VKSPYTAAVSVPNNLRALMSANLESEEGEPHPTRPNYTTFRFKQEVPIPSYLLAIAVGQLESRKIGPRSKVRKICVQGLGENS